MEMNNFEGRYYTRNKTVVVVHLNKEALPGDREIRWKGHNIVIIHQNDKPTKARKGVYDLTWNENGECVRVMNGECALQIDVKIYDLVHAVNPQSGIGSVKVEGCEECK